MSATNNLSYNAHYISATSMMLPPATCSMGHAPIAIRQPFLHQPLPMPMAIIAALSNPSFWKSSQVKERSPAACYVIVPEQTAG